MEGKQVRLQDDDSSFTTGRLDGLRVSDPADELERDGDVEKRDVGQVELQHEMHDFGVAHYRRLLVRSRGRALAAEHQLRIPPEPVKVARSGVAQQAADRERDDDRRERHGEEDELPCEQDSDHRFVRVATVEGVEHSDTNRRDHCSDDKGGADLRDLETDDIRPREDLVAQLHDRDVSATEPAAERAREGQQDGGAADDDCRHPATRSGRVLSRFIVYGWLSATDDRLLVDLEQPGWFDIRLPSEDASSA
ncbi:hypothetical protein [Curtobacterium flaccumfaciens]|uniref:hypothetical protein n=1 Tax=Curtobacterium flaccumfaciens TaxID=2035 RepID=UPI0038795CBD